MGAWYSRVVALSSSSLLGKEDMGLGLGKDDMGLGKGIQKQRKARVGLLRKELGCGRSFVSTRDGLSGLNVSIEPKKIFLVHVIALSQQSIVSTNEFGLHLYVLVDVFGLVIK